MKHKYSKKMLDTGFLHGKVYEALVRDLAFDRLSLENASNRISKTRSEWTYPLERVMCDPYFSKVTIQLRDYHKRLITHHDNVEALEKEGLQQFPINQNTFGLMLPLPLYCDQVIERARTIISGILNYFNFEEFSEMCSFGKRAAVNLPRLKSYLDIRGNTLNGTETQLAWFNAIRAHDITLMRATRASLRKEKLVSELKITCVPKSFKSVRTIAPDTVLGGFLSRGFGALIRKKLEENTHIDLALQQQRHRCWAKQASIDARHATIDMSKASDSFVWQHIERLLPVDWWPVCKVVRTPYYTIGNEVYKLHSYMLMGSGHTFPLQTLLFYALAKSVQELSNIPGKVSCYGDDIIIPTACASIFIKVMEIIGFSINHDKSFFDAIDLDRPSKTFFRESCGGDFINGVDVRPFSPEAICGLVPRNTYFAEIHKIINGLLLRWSEYEIPTTLHFLLGHLQILNKRICVVPEGETEVAGVPETLSLLTFYHCSLPTLEKGIRHYFALRVKRRKRKVKQEYLYYWYSLQGRKGDSEWDEASDTSIIDKKGFEIRKEREAVFNFSQQCESEKTAIGLPLRNMRL